MCEFGKFFGQVEVLSMVYEVSIALFLLPFESCGALCTPFVFLF